MVYLWFTSVFVDFLNFILKGLIMKKLYELTKGEYAAIYGKTKGNTTITGGFSRHKNAIEVAINSGIVVSKHILKEYGLVQDNVPETIEENEIGLFERIGSNKPSNYY